MERTKSSAPKEIRWRKTGGGIFIHKGRYIKPNQVFSATIEEIPKAFRGNIVPVDEKDVNVAVDVPKVEKLQYFTKHRGGGWYDVVDSNGKVVSEKAMKRDDAEVLIASLE
jgi:hypothetical protein